MVLNTQINKIQSYSTENNIQIKLIYSEISNSLDLDRPPSSLNYSMIYLIIKLDIYI